MNDSMTYDGRPVRSDRLVRLFVSEREVISLLRTGRNWRKDFANIPDDFRLEFVFHEPRCLGYYFVISHPSFDPVPEGADVPVRDGIYHEIGQPIVREMDT